MSVTHACIIDIHYDYQEKILYNVLTLQISQLQLQRLLCQFTSQCWSIAPVDGVCLNQRLKTVIVQRLKPHSYHTCSKPIGP